MAQSIRKSSDRGFFDHGWLKTYHTFSFGDYYDPQNMGFRKLRVINEDQVAPGVGFPTHPHRDMEILTFVVDGELAHKDSMGNGSSIHTEEIQLMSAGSGITHSEYNASSTKPVHLFQIWIEPDTKGLKPGYVQKRLSPSHNDWNLLVSKSGRDDSLKIHQDVEVWLAYLDSGKHLTKEIAKGRYGWLQVMSGELTLNGDVLKKGDGVALENVHKIDLKAETPAKVLFFDLN